MITYSNVHSPVWANADHTVINMVVNFDHLPEEEVLFGAVATDVEAHGRELFARAVAGDFGVIGPYVAPSVPVPASITRRQCARAMFMQGLITGVEALAMTTSGTPPALVEAMLAALQDDAEILARIDFAADTYLRGNPLLVALMEGTGADSAAIDAFFIAAAAL